MKVSNILNEQNEDCTYTTMKDLFHEKYEDIAGVIGMDYEDFLEMLQDVTAKHSDVNFQKEEEFLNKLLQLTDQETIYISTDDKLRERLDKLQDIINSGGNTMTTITGIQEFVRLLNKHTTTESAWEQSPEGEEARVQAEETCGQSSNQYVQTGTKETDFY